MKVSCDYIIMTSLLHHTDDLDATEVVEPVDNSPWAGSDRDYTYEEVGMPL